MKGIEMFLYKPNLIENGKFFLDDDYKWTVNGSTWVFVNGNISKTNTIAGDISQSDLLIPGQEYVLRFRLRSRTTGTLTIKNDSAGATIATLSANQVHEVVFIADGTDIIFEASSTFNGTISNASLVSTPEYYELDIDENTSIPLSFNIDTVFNVNVRKTNFSKTITLKGTNNNNLAFNHVYKINSDSLFNPNLKSRSVIKKNGIIGFDGSLCLDNINKTIVDKASTLEYEVSITGEIVDIMDILKLKNVRDMDFSAYDHDFTIANIQDSWNDAIVINGTPGSVNTSNSYTSPAVTGMTNVTVDGLNRPRLTFASPHSFSVGEFVYYDTNPALGTDHRSFDQRVLVVDSSTQITLECTRPTPFSGNYGGTVKRKEFLGIGYWYPCVNYGTYVNSYFAQASFGGNGLLQSGMTYIIKSYTTGDDFSNVGGNGPGTANSGDIFTAAQADQTSGNLIAGQTYYVSAYVPGDDFSNLGGSNQAGDSFVAGGVTITRDLGVEFGDNSSIGDQGPSAPLLTPGQSYIILRIEGSDDFTNVGAGSNTSGTIFTATGTTPSRWIYGSVLRSYGSLTPTNWANGSTLEIVTMYPTLWTGNTVLITLKDYSDGGVRILRTKNGPNSLEATDDYWEVYDFIPHIFLKEVWDKMFELLDLTYDSEILESKLFKSLIIPLDQAKFDSDVLEGDLIEMNEYLPDIKLSDLFNAVVNMFNLAVIQGDDKVIRFVNRGTFFDNAYIDWTDKLSSADQMSSQMTNKNMAKSYYFKYKDSSDFLNSDFNRDIGNIDNTSGLQNPIDRRYGDYYKVIRNDFLSNTNQVELIFEPSILFDGVSSSPLLMANCYNADEDGTNLSRKKSNRLLIAGMRFSNHSFSLVSNSNPGDNLIFYEKYPYAGHIDNYTQPYPSNDINWAKPLGVYFSYNDDTIPSRLDDAQWDRNSLYNKHWFKYINQITDKNSKIVTGTFKLNISDIYSLDFTKPIKVLDFNLKLNKIFDWDMNGSGLCKIEFVSR